MSIYCYITENKYYDNDTLILGFMSSLNHHWDSDCFYSIYCDDETEKAFNNKFNQIYDSLKQFDNLLLMNGDNLNMEYDINNEDIDKITSFIRMKF